MTDRAAALARLAIPAGALCACALMDPHRPPAWMICPFRAVTGLPCPMCGMTRGIAALIHGQWRAAVAFHWFSPLALAALAVWIAADAGHAARLWNGRRFHRWVMHPAPWLALFTLCTIYGVLRWCGILESPHA
ncbi:MAG: DUF2752 domain-containing protein [Bryobacterales bacterium]|nr:DUF2752 domain-containing protein [Bryobacterales bacterium]